MRKTLRGRPPLNLKMPQILEAVYRHRQVLGAVRELQCSDAYVHVRLKQVGLSLEEILELPSLKSLLERLERESVSR